MNIVDKLVAGLVPENATEKRVPALKKAMDELRKEYRDTISRILKEEEEIIQKP